MLWGHRACSNKTSLRLRCFRLFVRFAPSDPGVRDVALAWRSASCAGFSDGVIPRWLCGQDPLH